MHLVGADSQFARRLPENQFDASSLRLGMQDLPCTLDHVVQVEFLPRDLGPLPQQSAQPGNDLAGARVVLANVGEDLLDELEIGCRALRISSPASALLRMALRGWL